MKRGECPNVSNPGDGGSPATRYSPGFSPGSSGRMYKPDCANPVLSERSATVTESPDFSPPPSLGQCTSWTTTVGDGLPSESDFSAPITSILEISSWARERT